MCHATKIKKGNNKMLPLIYRSESPERSRRPSRFASGRSNTLSYLQYANYKYLEIKRAETF